MSNNSLLCVVRKFTCKCKNVAGERMQRGAVCRMCEVFVTDWSNLFFHIHDHTDARCLSFREVCGRRKTRMVLFSLEEL